MNLSNDTSLSPEERKLSNELAYLVADKMWRDLSHHFDYTNGKIWNLGQSNYEEGCSALSSLGIYKVAEHHTLFEVLVTVEKVPEYMEGLTNIDRRDFETLLSAFVENYISYDGTLPDSREEFSLPQKLMKVGNLLSECGYMEKFEGDYIWTEKISQIMVRWYIWDENGNCSRELDRLESEKNAHEFIQTLPFTLRKRLKYTLESKGEVSAVELMQRHWNGKRWTLLPRIKKTGINPSILPGGIRTLKTAFQIIKDDR